jgi:hypothetical protein
MLESILCCESDALMARLTDVPQPPYAGRPNVGRPK